MSDKEKKEILDQEKALEEDELEAVAGGGYCGCILPGGGLADGDETPCGCAVIGMGGYQDGEERCYCPFGGIGGSNW